MHFNPLHSLRLLPLLLCVSLSVFAQGNQPIGTVLAATGAVTARDAAGTVRNLVRKSEIFVHDTILVGADGFAQIKMADSAKIKFNPNTEFAFNEYSFDGNPDTPDTALMTMVKGGFRAISGSVGHGKGDDYRVDTPYASIGIRGTTHEALLDGGMLYTGVYEGGTTISNNQGSINTGINANYDFTLTTQGQPPQGLLVQPAVLANMQVNIADINTTKAATSAGTTAAADSSSNSDAGSNSNNDSNSNSSSSTTAATASTNNTAADQNGQGNAGAPASAAANTATAGGTAAATATSTEDGRTRLAAVINNIDRGAGSASGVGTTTTPALPAITVKDVEVITVKANPATTAAATTASAPATSNLNPVLNVQSAQELATASTGKTVATASSGASTAAATTAPASTATAGTSSGAATSGNNSATAGASNSVTTDASNSATAGATNSSSAGSTTSSSTGKQDAGTSTIASSVTPVVSVTDGKTTGNSAATTTPATTTTIPAITSTDKQDNGNSTRTNNSSGNGNSDSKTTGSSTANTTTIPAVSSTDKQVSSTGTNTSSGNGNSDSKTTASSGNGNSDSKITVSSGIGNSDSKTTVSSGNGNSDRKTTISSGNGNSDSKTTGSTSSGNNATNETATTASSKGNNSSDNGSGSSSVSSTTSSNSTGSNSTRSTTTGSSTSSSNDKNEAVSSTTIRSTSSLTTGNLQSLSYWDVDVRGALQSLVGEASTRNYLGSITLPYTKAVDISNKTGSLSYSSNSFAGTDELGAALKNVQMSFLLDLAGGSIRNGNLVVEDASRIKWTVTFAGSAGGSGASMTGLDGKLSGGGKVTSGSIQGVFVGASAKPDMIAAFNLQAGTNKVEGLVGLSP
ncbi:MAG: hypothetical protein WCI66_01500 [Gammaproteobacteria bacterium]